MLRTVTMAFSLAAALFASSCSDMRYGGSGIMHATPGDAAGSANIGTGSVTTGSAVPPEAKAAGIGLSP